MLNTNLMMYYLVLGLIILGSCTKNGNGEDPIPQPPTTPTNEVDLWVTSGDRTKLLEKQPGVIAFTIQPNTYPSIEVDASNAFQQMDGFGYSLTGGSAKVINQMSADARDKLLQELFACTGESLCISYLRISIGASDLDDQVFSYNDIPAGSEDLTLSKFNLSRDTINLIPTLKAILKINPNIKLMGSPWSAPVWMKSNNSSIGGTLLPKYYSVYAAYFVRYLTEMKKQGITLDAITVQNEPQHGGNNPSLVMSAAEQADFVKNHLGPAFQRAGLTTKIIIWDHNCDNPNYPISILNDPVAKSYIDGSAFHLYAGDISALSQVRTAHPDKNLYFTEQWTSANGDFSGDLQWHTRHVVIGSTRNWSKATLEWNLANDEGYGPHTPGGCTLCKGALTIGGNAVTRNVAYYVIGQASRFIPPGSMRIASSLPANLPNVAFLTPTGKQVLLVLNPNVQSEIFNIQDRGKRALVSLPPNSVGTFVW